MRESVIKKIPYSIILGQNEVDNELISYRTHGSEETKTLKINEFIKLINDLNNNRK